jgi:heat shock protein HslJ
MNRHVARYVAATASRVPRRPPTLAGALLALVIASPVSTPTPSTFPLEGTRWVLATDGDSPAPASPHEAYILLRRIGNNRLLGGSGGCNGLKGTYDMFAGRLRLYASALSGKPCPEPAAARETKLVEALRRTANYRIEGNTLALLAADGKALARFTAR